MTDLQQTLQQQRFANGYQLANGVQQNAENPKHFLIPPEVIKRHIRRGMFVELRLVSDRFSAHDDAADRCPCPSCNGEVSQPVLSHEQPLTLQSIAESAVSGRGWGEDFWVRVESRDGDVFSGIVDNHLIEKRFHEVGSGSRICFHADHVLAVHNTHRIELIRGMGADDLQELAAWLAEFRDDDDAPTAQG